MSLCPQPLQPWTPLPTKHADFYMNARHCIDNCCLTCDYRADLYSPIANLIQSLMVLGIVSFSFALFLALSQGLSRRLVMSEFNLLQSMSLAICVASISFFDIGRHKVACVDAITPSLGRDNRRCMVQGVLFVFGFNASTLAILMRIFSLHLNVVWNKSISRYVCSGLTLAVSAIFAGAGASYVQFGAGLFCAPKFPQVQYVIYIPTIIYTGLATILQLCTATHIVRTIYHVETSMHAADVPKCASRFEMYWHCIKKYLSIGWRTVVFTEFVTCIAITFSVVYFDAFDNKSLMSFGVAIQKFMLCVLGGESEDVCVARYRHPLGGRAILIWANVLMVSTYVLFLTEFRPLLFQGWYIILKHPRSLLSQKTRNRLLLGQREVSMNPIYYYRRSRQSQSSQSYSNYGRSDVNDKSPHTDGSTNPQAPHYDDLFDESELLKLYMRPNGNNGNAQSSNEQSGLAQV